MRADLIGDGEFRGCLATHRQRTPVSPIERDLHAHERTQRRRGALSMLGKSWKIENHGPKFIPNVQGLPSFPKTLFGCERVSCEQPEEAVCCRLDYENHGSMSTAAVRCLRATPTARSVLALSRRNPLSVTVAASLAHKESGGCLQPLLRPVVAAVAASPDLASLGRRIDGDGLKWGLASPVQDINGDGLKWGLLVSPQDSVLPTSSFMHRAHEGGDGNLMAALTEMVAVNRNARRPKKANHGKRPCSHVGRRQRRRQKNVIKNAP